MAKSNAEKAPETYEDLAQAISKFNRDEVLRILKSKAVDITSLDNTQEVYGQLVALRDLRIMDCLASQMEYFNQDMFQVDLENGRNRDFINQVLTKHYKKFNLNDTQTADALFSLSLAVGNVKIPTAIMKKNTTPEMYVALAASSNTTFSLLHPVKTSSLDANTVVDILYAAALCDNGQARLKDLMDSDYSITTANEDGQTVMDLLEKHIEENNYPTNKRGNQQKLADKNTLQFLRRCLKEDPSAEKAKKKKITIGCVVAGIVLVAAIVGFAFWYQNKNASDASTSSDTTSSDTNSTDTSTSDSSSAGTTLNTDTSLTVADGDTINLDYVGYVDDVAFEGGDTQGAGTSLTIGSGTYIDDFEEQLIGHNVGDQVDVVVTFPDEYSSNPDLAGKEATFKCTINGIYQ